MIAPEPLPTTPGRKGHWLVPVLLVTVATMVSQGFVRFTFAFVIEPMRADVLHTYTAAGLFGAANLLAYVIGVIIVMFGGHRLARETTIKLGLLGSTSGMFLVGAAPNTLIVFLGIIIAGMTSAGVWIPVSAVIADRAPAHRRGVAFGLMTTGVGLTIAATGIITEQVRSVVGPGAWREVWMIEAGIALTITIVVTLGLRSSGRVIDQTRWSQLSRWGALVRDRLSLAYGIYGIGFALYVHYLVVGLESLGGMEPNAASRAYSLLGTASIFGSLVLARLSDHWNRIRTLAAAIAITGLCSLAIAFVRDHTVLTLSAMLYGFVMTGIGSVLSAYLGDVLRPNDIPIVFGSATVTLGSAQFIAPPIGGWIADQTGSFAPTFLVAVVTSLIAALLFWRMPEREKAEQAA